MYEIDTEMVVHETDTYVVDVGMYPGEALECYRVWNKDTGVLEYAHSVLFYACQWSDEATKILKDGVKDSSHELPEV